MPVCSLWSPPHRHASVHLVGICGAGMKALAELLHDRGWSVSGCDGDPDPGVFHSLIQLEIDVRTGHASDHLTHLPDLLIYSAAIPPGNEDRQAAARSGVPQLSYVEALSCLSHEKDAVAIAGTHGKSTTTAMLGQILNAVKPVASVICGAENTGTGRSGMAGNGPVIVMEACEFRRHFLNLHPRIACLLGIEADHFDCYPTLPDAVAAYREFASKVMAGARDGERTDQHPQSHLPALIARADCRVTMKMLQELGIRPITYSVQNCGADWQIEMGNHPSSSPQMAPFRIHFQGVTSPDIQLSVPGLHNIQNALAAAVCAYQLGLSLEEIAAGLNTFRGLHRRFERRPGWRGAVVIDDYAHHPSEIRATLLAARDAFPDRRLICVFQPHQVSRTAALLNEFAAALSLADRVYLVPIYAAREKAGDQQVLLARELMNLVKVPAGFITALDQVWGTIQTDAGTDAVLLTLGAGNLSRIHHEDIKRPE